MGNSIDMVMDASCAACWCRITEASGLLCSASDDGLWDYYCFDSANDRLIAWAANAVFDQAPSVPLLLLQSKIACGDLLYVPQDGAMLRRVRTVATTSQRTVFRSCKGSGACDLMEEESMPHYHPKSFYPVRLHEKLNNRYQIATKLGFGATSTVWLAKDCSRWRWLSPRYVALKVCTNHHPDDGDDIDNELRIMEQITRSARTHDRRRFVRTLLDSFYIEGPHGRHLCMAFEPLREPLWILARRFQDHVIPSDVLKLLFRAVLEGLDYLHTACDIIHTDLKPDNILIRLKDHSAFHRLALDEQKDPMPSKVLNNRTIYLSRNAIMDDSLGFGIPIISDFGLSVKGAQGRKYGHQIQALQYRAPEVILSAGWSYSADIWNIALTMWKLLEGHDLLCPSSPSSTKFSCKEHLAYCIAILGPPPRELLRRGHQAHEYFNSDGTFLFPDLIPERYALEDQLRFIDGQDRDLFIGLLRRMLRWMPEERCTAAELLSDPWLQI